MGQRQRRRRWPSREQYRRRYKERRLICSKHEETRCSDIAQTPRSESRRALSHGFGPLLLAPRDDRVRAERARPPLRSPDFSRCKVRARNSPSLVLPKLAVLQQISCASKAIQSQSCGASCSASLMCENVTQAESGRVFVSRKRGRFRKSGLLSESPSTSASGSAGISKPR